MMDWPTMERIVRIAGGLRCSLVDVTGGAPELNRHLREFVAALREGGRPVQVRTNLTVLAEPRTRGMPEFYRDHGVRLVASLPCYLEENVRAQRGPGVYQESVEAIRRLNLLGYGTDPSLPLDLVYNPGGPFLPPDQTSLETDYRRELNARFGIAFRKLLTITNMPIGRYAAVLRREKEERDYCGLLEASFNPRTVEHLMCRHQISIGWDGRLYDCDFNLALGLPVNHGAPSHVNDFAAEALATRRIVTGGHCFGCTAGSGSSCKGALA
jgi:radical SAM/Cys-rich protein